MRAPVLFCGALIAAALIFLLAPGIDLAASRLFYDPAAGFFLAEWPPLRAVERAIPLITWGIGGIVVLGALWLIARGRPLWRLDARALVFIALATALGPGLLTNTVLKDHWGRARPAQIEAFGGAKAFSRAPLIADQCDRNCSFVSGHAALGFSLVGFAFLLPAGPRRRGWIAAAIGFGALVGLGRIAAGRHFLSDIVYAGFLVTATTWLLYQGIVVRDWLGRAWATFGGRIALCVTAVAFVEAASMLWIDRPLALCLHSVAGPVQPFFGALARLGLGYPYLVFFGLSFALLRWGGAVPAFRGRSAAMRAAATVPAFLFAAIAAAGLVADLLKIVVGRTRPKLLFASDAYDFTWFGWRADHWSFPSGHAATAAALMLALWWLWPRYWPVYAIVTIGVAAGRVVIGAHYLSDVLMGIAIGAAATWGVAALFAARGFDLGGRSVRAV
jgi:lipid A 4'-phosphatase